MKKTIAAIAIAALTFTGCSAMDDYNDDRGKGDAPVGTRHETPRQIWQNIDRFPNVVAFCIGANGAYTTTREAAIVVVKDDPNCVEGGALAE